MLEELDAALLWEECGVCLPSLVVGRGVGREEGVERMGWDA